jgi:quercetin dioxygenase-like cupin family protein
LLVAGALGAAALGIARATPAFGVTGATIVGPVILDETAVQAISPEWRAWFKTQGSSELSIVTRTITPRGHSGWHSHPGPVFIAVKAGTATWYDAVDCSRHIYPAGTAYVEPPGHAHLVRNDGDTDLELVALFLSAPGVPTRIDEPDPGCL